MKDTMSDDLAKATETEKKAVTDFDALVAAKEKEIAACQKAIEGKIERIGNLGVEIETMKADLSDTEQDMIEDKKFLEDMDEQCATKQKEWDARCKTRTEELLALSDTIKILNDDDALELFKKTLPSASFLQIQVSQRQLREKALEMIQATRKRKGLKKGLALDFIALALRGQKVGFEKVIKLMDEMVVTLKKEQVDDDK